MDFLSKIIGYRTVLVLAVYLVVHFIDQNVNPNFLSDAILANFDKLALLAGGAAFNSKLNALAGK